MNKQHCPITVISVAAFPYEFHNFIEEPDLARVFR